MIWLKTFLKQFLGHILFLVDKARCPYDKARSPSEDTWKNIFIPDPAGGWEEGEVNGRCRGTREGGGGILKICLDNFN